MGHLIVEESDSGEVGLDGTGGLALRLQIENVAHQMLTADVLQLLQMVVSCEIGAEPLDCLVVAILRAEAALPVMPRQLVQLGNESVVNTFRGHIEKAPYIQNYVQMGALHPLARRVVSGASPQI